MASFNVPMAAIPAPAAATWPAVELELEPKSTEATAKRPAVTYWVVRSASSSLIFGHVLSHFLFDNLKYFGELVQDS